MRVIVTGSRTWDRPDVIRDCLTIIAKAAFAEGDTELVVVHGACPKGADAIADAWALEQGRLWPIRAERHPANWDRDGRRAGFIRNEEMVLLGADLLLAFIRDGSRGASHTVRRAEEHEIPTKVIDYAEVSA
jgi:hypothetical protein